VRALGGGWGRLLDAEGEGMLGFKKGLL